jgi:hypothetical protein
LNVMLCKERAWKQKGSETDRYNRIHYPNRNFAHVNFSSN